MPSGLKNLEWRLEVFAAELAPQQTFSEKNLRLRVYSTLLAQYIMTHGWWHLGYCDLYRCLIGNIREAIPQTSLQLMSQKFILEKQAKCFQHAQAIAELCAIVLDIGIDDLVLDIEVAECAYQAGRILCLGRAANARGFHLSPRQVTEQATHCLLLIKRLSAMYSILAPVVSLQFGMKSLTDSITGSRPRKTHPAGKHRAIIRGKLSSCRRAKF